MDRLVITAIAISAAVGAAGFITTWLIDRSTTDQASWDEHVDDALHLFR